MAKIQDYFKIVTPKASVTTMSDSQNIGDQGTYSNSTWYQRLIQGSASRLTRYREYDLMDNDVEVSRSLDTIAEEMIGSDPNSDLPLELVIEGDKEQHIPSSVVMTLRAALRYWSDLHDWNIRLFKIARNTIKYGDCFMLRHKETQKWEYVHSKNVVAAIVDDRDMTRVLGWQIKRDTKVPNSPYNQPTGHFGSYSNELVDTFPADDVIWFTLNDDIAETAPFGESVLRAVYRAQKQKELLEDAILIYRIQRAPERRVFYIDVGKMPPQRVKAYLEGIKNEIRQRKVPTFGGGVEQVDSVYNPQSMSEDFFFAQRPDGKGSKVDTLPGGCFSLDTKIPLLDGREITLETAIQEYTEGKQNWVYSVDNDGSVIPGMVSWAGVTQESADVLELTLDNNEIVTCTPDHKFPVWGKGYIEAKDLTPEDSIIHFETRQYKIDNKNASKKYLQVYDHNTKNWEFVHKKVRNYFDNLGIVNELVYENIEYRHEVIHHNDINRFNNNPDNLAWMGKIDHLTLHSTMGKYASSKRLEKQNDDPEWKKLVYAKSGATMKKRAQLGGDLHESYKARYAGIRNSANNHTIVFCDDMLTIVRHLVDNGIIETIPLLEKLNITKEFMDLWNILNVDVIPETNKNLKLVGINKTTSEFQHHHLDMLLKQYGYKNWQAFKAERLSLSKFDDSFLEKYTPDLVELMKTMIDLVKVNHKPFYLIPHLEANLSIWNRMVEIYNSYQTNCKKKLKEGTIRYHHFDNFSAILGFDNFKDFLSKKVCFNHRVVSIKKLDHKIPVGTLTIDQKEEFQKCHNFALSSGVYAKNSGLGELADLEYFQWKVFRGLRIPLSYMREGQDNAMFNDGKSGTAYIQELRFAMYIKRLQNYITRTMDAEFKRYVRMAGISVDPTIFRIKLNEPENFGIYRQQQLDNDLLGTYTNANGIEHMSKRFGLKKYLQLSDEEILLNERMRAEELGMNPDNLTKEDMLKLYGPPPAEGGMDMGGGMMAGTLGGLGGGMDLSGTDMGMEATPGVGPEGGAETGMPAAGGTPPALPA